MMHTGCCMMSWEAEKMTEKYSNLDKLWFCLKNTPPAEADRCFSVLWSGRLPSDLPALPTRPSEGEEKEGEGLPWKLILGGAALWWFLRRK